MQKLGLFASIVLLFCTLTACVSNNGYDQTKLCNNLLRETWMREINLDPNYWVRGADPWYYTGYPYSAIQYSRAAPPFKAITTSMVTVPEFTNVQVSGDFQVQIVGRAEHNSVFIVGPNALTRQIAVDVTDNNTIYIHKNKDSKACLKNVIVRINVHNLHMLKNLGTSNIYGRDVMSSHLIIRSCDCGNIFLSGDMNVVFIHQTGTGTVAVLGANAPCLNIRNVGNGNVRVTGHVGIQNIYHVGNGAVNVLGADSDSLMIHANGGVTSVVGYVNLKKVWAYGCSRVYVYWINSNSLYVTAGDTARVGLAGAVTNMNVEMTNASRFEGQYLRGNTVYVRTRNTSHANVASDNKIFAAALDSSSIYIFGSPKMVSRYTSQKGAIIPIWYDSPPPAPFPPTLAYRGHRSYKGE